MSRRMFHEPKQPQFDFLDFLIGVIIIVIVGGLWVLTR